MRRRRTAAAGVALLLCALAAAVYWPVRDAGFVNYDDDEYAAGNPRVAAGVTADGARWAFGATLKGNWHPLTWLSLMSDVTLFGLDPARMHQVNVLLHAANGVLLFLLLRGLTGALWRSALVAALFLAHPLHVESVAWISERKDVLSTLFWLLALAAYLRQIRRPRPLRLLPVALLLTLGLMAKAMLVTLPLTLLLLDLWPLGRLTRGRGLRACLLEKLPLFALAGAGGALALVAQNRAGSLGTLQAFPLAARVGNALASYGWYLGKALWPTDLAYFYPLQAADRLWAQAGLAGVLLAAAGAAGWRLRRRLPCVAVGLAWYLVTLLPVVGLVQVGLQSHADRYSYVPLIGIFVILAWGGWELARTHRALRRVAVAAALAGIAALAAAAGAQAGYWHDSRSLAGHAARVAPSAVALMDLGISAQLAGASDEALGHLQRALALDPANVQALYNLGWVHECRQEWGEALAFYRLAALRAPQDATNATSLGALLISLGRGAEAVPWLEQALRYAPAYDRAHSLLGAALLRLGERRRAEAHLREALRLDPGDREARLALAQLARGD
jgi:tetratricopeptide (TPR) repeat protein